MPALSGRVPEVMIAGHAFEHDRHGCKCDPEGGKAKNNKNAHRA
jgi:hypothetical protein